MQVNTQNIQRPTLFSEFFTLELIWNNEYLTYIQTTIKTVTSNICKTAKTITDNIKKSLKSAKNNHAQLIICGKGMKKLIRELRESESSGVINKPFRAEMRKFQEIRREIKSLQHNKVLVLM